MIEKCLIIGLGQIGLQYDMYLKNNYVLSHSRAISLHPKFELIAATDKNKQNRDFFFKNYKKPVFSNLKKALTETKPSIIIISTPSNSHLSILEEILEIYSPKTILCEKPLELSLNKAKKMVKLCKKKNINLYVNYFRRSDPGSIKIKKMINEKIIKAPIKGFVWYSKGIKNNGSHFINLLEYWLGKCNETLYLSKGKYYKTLSDSDYNFILKFNNAEIIFQSSPEASKSYNSIELISKSGRLIYENGGEHIYWQSVFEKYIKNKSRKYLNKKKMIQNTLDKYQLNVLNALYDSLQGNDSNICTGEQSLETLKTIDKIIFNKELK